MSNVVISHLFLRDALDAIPFPVFILDSNLVLLFWNKQACDITNAPATEASSLTCGHVLNCLNAALTIKGCGHTQKCSDCKIRQGVDATKQQKSIIRQQITIVTGTPDAPQKTDYLMTISPYQYNGSSLSLLMLEDMSEINTLRKLIPICATCKKVRRDDQYWESVEEHFKQQTLTDFSHGICPDCANELIKDMDEFKPEG